MDLNGDNTRRLTRTPGHDLSPTIKALGISSEEKLPILRSNGVVAFTISDDTTSEIYLVEPDGINATRFNMTAYGFDSSPRWSPDGTKLMFVRTMTSHEEILVADLDTAITSSINKSTVPFAGLGWSPDGERIVFSKGDANHKFIFIMNANGTDVKIVRGPTDVDALDTDPSWSPDGTRIAFTREMDGNRNVYVMNIDGTDQRRLTESLASDSHPHWSPEADQIIFVSNRNGNNEIYAMNPFGNNERNLSNNTASDSLPRYSPDGTKIIFASDRDGENHLFLMDTNGRNQKRLMTLNETSSNPDFGPYFESTIAESSPSTVLQVVQDNHLRISAPDWKSNSDSSGQIITGSEVILSSTVTNSISYSSANSIVVFQVRNQLGVAEQIWLVNASIPAASALDVTTPWIPADSGSYEISVFITDGSESPFVLANMVVSDLEVRAAA
jgi:Tol biopolymer transport system component